VQIYDERTNQGRKLQRVGDERGDWSPDGKHIVYMRFRQGDENISVRSMDANGNDEGGIADCDFVVVRELSR
jgi:Tol biopolymer transport system component